MNYKKLPIILKRYSFAEKMRVLQYYSKQIINANGVEIKNGQPMAWELETFLLFSIKADEYQFKDFKGKNINSFIEMINCIKNYQHPNLISKGSTIRFVDFLLIALGSTQFDIQTYNMYKYYRYNYFFNYVSKEINMKNEFYKKFGIDYRLFLELGSILNVFNSIKANIESKILEFIILKYSKASKLLLISREDFKKEIDKFSDSCIDNYLYCVRPSYIYPFIEYNKIVNFPLPHCMTRAITDSLLYRLTDGNSNLRTLFGKNVLENYLYDILVQSNLFTETIKEKTYKKNKNICKTSDIMCRSKERYLFFECKATVPYAKTRCMKEIFIFQEINKISDNIIQLYNQVYLDFKNTYDFFEDKCTKKFNRNNCYGIVVLLEESYINRELVYKDVAKKLNISKNDKLYNWIINHIKVCNLYDIERYAFSNTDFIANLKKQEKNNLPYDFPLSGENTKSTLSNDNVINFKKSIINNIEITIRELIDVGLLPKK